MDSVSFPLNLAHSCRGREKIGKNEGERKKKYPSELGFENEKRADFEGGVKFSSVLNAGFFPQKN